METHRESKLMLELEERRALYATRLEALSDEECLRVLKEGSEKARKSLGLNLPRRQHLEAQGN